MAIITAISISSRKGMRKTNIASGMLVAGFGLENDAHGGDWHRQISFLAEESIEFMRKKGLDVVAGNFAENLTTSGIDLVALPVGTHIQIGDTSPIISQLGKICHHPCAIFHQAGDCVMPREVIFGIVTKGGPIAVGAPIKVLDQHSSSAAIIASNSGLADISQHDIQTINKEIDTAFTRLDKLKPSGENLGAILTDLNKTQKIDHIFFYDPTGEYKSVFEKESSQKNLYYCTQKDDFINVAK